MINWTFIITRDGVETSALLKEDEVLQINETDYLDIVVSLTEEYFEFGEPYLIVGDVPIELDLIYSGDHKRKFQTVHTGRSHEKQLFYNYFGESSVSLCFRNELTNNTKRIKVDIRARRANSELAASMVDFISENMDDALLLCFSKSQVGSGSKSLNENALTRFSLLKHTVLDISAKKGIFFRDYKHTFEHQLTVTHQGQAIGPESVQYLLSHLDKMRPTTLEYANVKINQRSYLLDDMPTETLITNADVFENRVIFSFLHAAKQFLIYLYQNSKQQIFPDNRKRVIQTDSNSDFVSFDHLLQRYQNKILKHHINDIINLQKQIEHLISLYKNRLKVTLLPQLRPKMTAFVSARPHYRQAFINIHEWYSSDAPDIESNSFLLGLRNLASIYELVCLLILHRVIVRELQYEFIDAKYVVYDETVPFNGKLTERPNDKSNNLFNYSIGPTKIDVRYEPRIYQYRDKIAEPGDLIHVNNRRANMYGQHYFCPDYVMKISQDGVEQELVIILDAKYQSYDNIKKYSIEDAEGKYLYNVFQLKENMNLGSSPVKALLLLYAHGSKMTASRLHKRHLLGEPLEVLPQSLGMKITPDEDSQQRLSKPLKYMITKFINEIL